MIEKKIFREIISNDRKKMHSILLIFDLLGQLIPEKCSCTCIWGSFYGLSKRNQGKFCRHIRKALEEYSNEQIEENLKIEGGVK